MAESLLPALVVALPRVRGAALGALSTARAAGAWAAGRASRRARAFWARAIVLLVLFGTPGVVDTLEQLVEAATGVECCEGGACDERGALGCSHACGHCVCCGHTRACFGGLVPVAVAPAASGPAALPHSEGELALGYRAPPFRPPVRASRQAPGSGLQAPRRG